MVAKWTRLHHTPAWHVWAEILINTLIPHSSFIFYLVSGASKPESFSLKILLIISQWYTISVGHRFQTAGCCPVSFYLVCVYDHVPWSSECLLILAFKKSQTRIVVNLPAALFSETGFTHTQQQGSGFNLYQIQTVISWVLWPWLIIDYCHTISNNPLKQCFSVCLCVFLRLQCSA